MLLITRFDLKGCNLYNKFLMNKLKDWLCRKLHTLTYWYIKDSLKISPHGIKYTEDYIINSYKMISFPISVPAIFLCIIFHCADRLFGFAFKRLHISLPFREERTNKLIKDLHALAVSKGLFIEECLYTKY